MFAIDAAVPIIIVQVRFRIVLDRFQFHDVAVGRFSNIVGYLLGMAAGRIIDDQRLAIAFGRSLGRRIGLFRGAGRGISAVRIATGSQSQDHEAAQGER